MAELSGKALKKLGKRLRNEATEKDISLLEDYRDSFDSLLIEVSLGVERCFRCDGLKFLLSGRSKRTKSIIRKLRRPQNRSMDLSRVSDLVGIRVIVASLEDQHRTLEIMQGEYPGCRVYDYRQNPTTLGYRCIHYIVQEGKKFVEVQLRTIHQHLWAVESESFGEKVKEGTRTDPVDAYLRTLSESLSRMELGQEASPIQAESDENLWRRPLDIRLPRMIAAFTAALDGGHEDEAGTSYVIIFDKAQRTLIHDFGFDESERDAALAQYRHYCRLLDQGGKDVLILNSASRKGLEVTHPQFF